MTQQTLAEGKGGPFFFRAVISLSCFEESPGAPLPKIQPTKISRRVLPTGSSHAVPLANSSEDLCLWKPPSVEPVPEEPAEGALSSEVVMSGAKADLSQHATLFFCVCVSASHEIEQTSRQHSEALILGHL